MLTSFWVYLFASNYANIYIGGDKMSDFIKAFNHCKAMFNNGKIEPFTPYQINEIWKTLLCFRDGSSVCETISEPIANYFKSYNFKVSTRGIGWRIEL